RAVDASTVAIAHCRALDGALEVAGRNRLSWPCSARQSRQGSVIDLAAAVPSGLTRRRLIPLIRRTTQGLPLHARPLAVATRRPGTCAHERGSCRRAPIRISLGLTPRTPESQQCGPSRRP